MPAAVLTMSCSAMPMSKKRFGKGLAKEHGARRAVQVGVQRHDFRPAAPSSSKASP